MEIVVLFAEKWHTAPFGVLEKDIDDFILVANYMIGLGKESESKIESKTNTHKEKRIKVNDKTATGGWW